MDYSNNICVHKRRNIKLKLLNVKREIIVVYSLCKAVDVAWFVYERASLTKICLFYNIYKQPF